jgi:hypothetical protein
MKRLALSFALAAVILGAGRTAHCAQGVDMDLVDNPRSIVITDPLAERRWTELFSSDPNHMRRQITELVQREPKQALTLLAARLLYVGDPWERREDENHSLGQWRRNSAVVNRAILRELRLRWPKNKSMLAIYARFINQETDPELVLSTLVNVLRLDADQAKTFALRAADATIEGALPSAQNSQARQLCTAFLVENFGIDAPESQRALNSALLRATGVERTKAIMLVGRGELSELLELASLRMLAENKQRALAGEDQISLMLLCARIQGVKNSDLALGLADLAMTSPRALASAACTALSSGVPFEVNLPLTGLAEYASVVTDLALRHAILELLLRLNPALVEKVAGSESPWTALSSHRNQLSTWEWEGN